MTTMILGGVFFPKFLDGGMVDITITMTEFHYISPMKLAFITMITYNEYHDEHHDKI